MILLSVVDETMLYRFPIYHGWTCRTLHTAESAEDPKSVVQQWIARGVRVHSQNPGSKKEDDVEALLMAGSKTSIKKNKASSSSRSSGGGGGFGKK